MTTHTTAGPTKGWTASVDGDSAHDGPVGVGSPQGAGDDPALPALAERSDAWLVGRARELVAKADHSGADDERQRRADELDRLLTEAQHRGEPRMVAQLLRAAILVRVGDSTVADSAEPLLDELLAHTRRHGLVILQADAHALRGRRQLLVGAEDKALSEVAVALALLDEDVTPDAVLGRRTSDVLMAETLMDIGLVLTQLGVYEVADKVITRAHRFIRDSGGPQMISVALVNRARLLLGWGLRLERIGETTQAIGRFTTAAAIATAVEALLLDRPDQAEPALCPVIASAHALAHHSSMYVERLTRLLDTPLYPRDLILVSIALARCLEAEGHTEQAIKVLGDVRERLDDASERTLRLCLIREFARLSGTDGGERTTNALEQYATELEEALWATRESRITTLNARREHERLSFRHAAVERQALQDPLTGLANRRALDEKLESLAASPANHPLAIALIDLDRFKDVNDRMSHAAGDDVLRVIASTIRDTLRGNDIVARYGGDEFIALLPGAPLHAAEAALRRAVSAVAALPRDLSHGVTLSVGVVSLRPQETAARALARADAAMYQAKRKGGNDIVSAPAGSSGDTTVAGGISANGNGLSPITDDELGEIDLSLPAHHPPTASPLSPRADPAWVLPEGP
ncbi:MAG TPA: GGDEF domain-containing protein [Actinophytocola sp.]|uniref:GGDEF domain-containing protein n=1 Tax=Actinophytocola sp. TaxID=1872138 RepID=UPI002DDCBE9D|nr:GGDEF domain-containing protein [Actinophytocola sp.]HEV2778091.1 GGDEF domain-containing protein [Actinophytocola sp.]